MQKKKRIVREEEGKGRWKPGENRAEQVGI